MTDSDASGRTPRRRGRGAWRVLLPEECAGLVAAMNADRDGDPRPLKRWNREARPLVERALARELGAADAEEAAQRVLVEAWKASRAQTRIRDELAWSASLARAYKFRRAMDRRRQVALLARRTPGEAPPAETILERRATVARVRAAIASLPRPFRDALVLRLRGWDHASIAAWLAARRAVEKRRPRTVLREAERLLVERLAAARHRRREEKLRNLAPTRCSRDS